MGAPQFWILRRHRIGLGHFPKKRFHFAGGRKSDQDPAVFVADVRPDMGHLAWRKQRIARSQSIPLFSHLDYELTFNSVEPFILVIMQVSRRAALLSESVLDNEETAAVLLGHLEGNRANAKPPLFAESVFACRD
jgi:hypothetical protein